MYFFGLSCWCVCLCFLCLALGGGFFFFVLLCWCLIRLCSVCGFFCSFAVVAGEGCGANVPVVFVSGTGAGGFVPVVGVPGANAAPKVAPNFLHSCFNFSKFCEKLFLKFG